MNTHTHVFQSFRKDSLRSLEADLNVTASVFILTINIRFPGARRAQPITILLFQNISWHTSVC